MKLFYKFIIVYLILSIVIISFLWTQKEIRINDFLAETKEINLHNYNAIYNEYKRISNIIFSTEINTKEILDIYKDINKSNAVEKIKLREKLFFTLQNTYQPLKNNNLNLLHFHLANNESFLRFHKPDLFSDNLSNVRETVSYVNKNKLSCDCFEVGRIFSGYRVVYPLADEKQNHLGSVEISFSALAFNIDFIEMYKKESIFLVKKEIVDKKLFKTEKNNFEQSAFENYYYEKNSVETLKDKYNMSVLSQKNTSSQTLQIINNGINKPISIYDKKLKKVLTLIPVYSSLTQKNNGLYIIQSNSHYIEDQENHFYMMFIITHSLILIIFIVFFRNLQKQIQLDTIISEADSGIGIMDMEGNFLEVNQAYCDLLGFRKEEMLTQNCLRLTIEKEKKISQQLIKQALDNGKISKMKKTCYKKDGSIIHLEGSLTLLPSKDKFIVVVNSLEDRIQLENLNKSLENDIQKAILNIKEKETLLFEQSKTAALGQMIDAIAHQWINPLSIIRLYAQSIELSLERNIKNEKELKELSLEFANKTIFQIDHLVDTLNEFRTFFRPNKKLEDIKIATIVNSVTILMKDELIKNSINVDISGDLELTVTIIPNEFKHILINMFNNSKDAFNNKNIRNKNIFIKIMQQDEFIIITIQDNAGGIPEDVIEHIFDSNFTTKDEGKGTGIGLYMSQQIVQKIGGKIKVENVSNGVLFTIMIRKYSKLID